MRREIQVKEADLFKLKYLYEKKQNCIHVIDKLNYDIRKIDEDFNNIIYAAMGDVKSTNPHIDLDSGTIIFDAEEQVNENKKSRKQR